MVTLESNQTPQSGPQLKLESLTRIDLSKFSQSELHSLSLCSSSSFDLHDTSDLVIPNVDPSSFNESAGTRRQTFSRPRSRSSTSDPHHAENASIVNSLKQLINQNDHSNSAAVAVPVAVSDNCKQMVVYRDDQVKAGKRKRIGEHKKVVEIDERIEFKVVNGNGEAVDFVVLEEHADDLYEAELTRRTAGVDSEEVGLQYFRGLEGQWCSRRKKRRIVDAGTFGDWLPVGWKLVLALRRRDGHFSVYCRTFMSPSGKHFPSCKDVAYYLQSHHGFSDSNMPITQGIVRAQHANDMGSGSLHLWNMQQHAGSIHKPSEVNHDVTSNVAVPRSLLSEAHGKELSLVEIDNLPEVQVRDTFECRNCKMTFDERESYMQHLLSFHQKTTRRFRLGSSVGKGVIIKDGKFECQFCHKEFEDRRRYSCHVGIHVRTDIQRSRKLQSQGNSQKSIQPPTQDAAPSRASKLDALLEIAQSSFLETSRVGNNDKHNGSFSPKQLNNEETLATGFDHELSLGSHQGEKTELMVDRSLDKDLSAHNGNCTVYKSSALTVGSSQNGNSMSVVCANSAKHPKLAEVGDTENYGLESDRVERANNNSENGISKTVVCVDSTKSKLAEVGRTENCELEIECRIEHGKINYDVVIDPTLQDIEKDHLQGRDAEQSLHSNPAIATIPEGEHVYGAQQKLDSARGSEELKLDEISPLNGQGLPSLPEVSKDFADNATVEDGFNSFISLGSEAVMLDMTSGHQLTTICVWCRTEFYHEAIDLEGLSDSIGFMCPTCKAKISGHLDSGLSMNSHCF